MSIKKSLSPERITGVSVATLVLSGSYITGYVMLNTERENERYFQESKEKIFGTVLKEEYQNTLSPVEKWDGAMSYSNETVKLDSKYTLTVETDDGRILGVSVIDTPRARKEALDALVDVGARISFPKGNLMDGDWFLTSRKERTYPGETWFAEETQIGNKRADRIRILPN